MPDGADAAVGAGVAVGALVEAHERARRALAPAVQAVGRALLYHQRRRARLVAAQQAVLAARVVRRTEARDIPGERRGDRKGEEDGKGGDLDELHACLLSVGYACLTLVCLKYTITLTVGLMKPGSDISVMNETNNQDEMI